MSKALLALAMLAIVGAVAWLTYVTWPLALVIAIGILAIRLEARP